VSVASGGGQADLGSWVSDISADGRFVAFESGARNLVPSDTNGAMDVFVHDRATQSTSRVSVSSTGAQAITPDGSFMPSISGDGRWVAFQSWAANLVPGDTNAAPDVFVHDRQTLATTRVSVGSGGAQANGASFSPSISHDGRWVAFASAATNLAAGDVNGAYDVFVRDLQTGATTLVSVASAGTHGDNHSMHPSVSADGRWVAFQSFATNLVASDANGAWDVFLHDRQMATTTRVSVGAGGGEGNRSSSSPTISADGVLVAFVSEASTLVAGDTNNGTDVFVHNRSTAMTTRVSVGPGGIQSNHHSFAATISRDGRWVAFRSDATNLVSDDTNLVQDVFVHDRLTGTTTRVSVGLGGGQGNATSGHPSIDPPSISSGGRWIAFESEASNLVSADTNNDWDVFVHDRGDLECVTLAPAAASVPAAGATGLVLVTAPATCEWAAVSNDPAWLTITGGSSGVGNSTVSYSVAANAGVMRTGTLTVGGEVFTVTQAGADPTTPLPPQGLVVASVFGNFVTLRWTIPTVGPVPTDFVVEGGVTPGQVLASLATGSAAPTVTFTAPTGSFYVRVHALSGGVRSAASNEVRLHVNVPLPPSAPVNLLGLVNGSTLTLDWTTTYGGGAPTSLTLDVSGAIVTSVPLGLSNSFTFAGVPGGTYTLAVRAVNAAGSSPPSNSITLTFPGPCSGAPATPVNVVAYHVGRRVFINWAPATTGPAPAWYVLNVTGSLAGSLATGERAFTTMIPSGLYHLSVAAANACGVSAGTMPLTIAVP
jgi:Tol biopolymer transport system component